MRIAASSRSSATPSPTLSIPPSTASPANPTTPLPSSSTTSTPRALALTLPPLLAVYYALARYLNLDLPALVDPWRSILVITLVACTTIYALDAVADHLASNENQRSLNTGVLIGAGYTGWMGLVILTVRDRGMEDGLAILVACWAGVATPVVWLLVWMGQCSRLSKGFSGVQDD